MDKGKLIIFDFDGVILDSTGMALWGLRRTYPDLTKEEHQEMQHLRSAIGSEELLKNHRVIESDLNTIKGEYSKKKQQCEIFDGMDTVINALSEKYYLAINTNAFEKNIAAILEKNNLKDYFGICTTRDDSNSKVEKNALISEHFGNPEKVIFITDSTGDVVEAHESGIASIGVTWGMHSAKHFDEVKDLGLYAVVDTPAELEAKIREFLV